jgi:hypothetical protein
VNTELETHSREVEAFAQLQRDFVATASHELRTPLTSILGYLELVLGSAPEELPDEPRAHVQIAYRSGQRLLAIVGDLVTVDEVDAGAMEIDPQDVTLDELVAPTLLAFGPACERKGLRLVVDGEAGAARVHADRDRMDQVLGNLVGNAVKFTTEGEVRLALRAAGGRAELRVLRHRGRDRRRRAAPDLRPLLPRLLEPPLRHARHRPGADDRALARRGPRRVARRRERARSRDHAHDLAAARRVAASPRARARCGLLKPGAPHAVRPRAPAAATGVRHHG